MARGNMVRALCALVKGESYREGSVSTDGVTLYSCAMPIGGKCPAPTSVGDRYWMNEAKTYWVVDEKVSPSKTTTSQIRTASMVLVYGDDHPHALLYRATCRAKCTSKSPKE